MLCTIYLDTHLDKEVALAKATYQLNWVLCRWCQKTELTDSREHFSRAQARSNIVRKINLLAIAFRTSPSFVAENRLKRLSDAIFRNVTGQFHLLELLGPPTFSLRQAGSAEAPLMTAPAGAACLCSCSAHLWSKSAVMNSFVGELFYQHIWRGRKKKMSMLNSL